MREKITKNTERILALAYYLNKQEEDSWKEKNVRKQRKKKKTNRFIKIAGL